MTKHIGMLMKMECQTKQECYTCTTGIINNIGVLIVCNTGLLRKMWIINKIGMNINQTRTVEMRILSKNLTYKQNRVVEHNRNAK